MPPLDDYIEIWKEWESSMEELSYDKCNKLWAYYVLLGGSKEKAKDLAESLKKLPTTSRSIFFFSFEEAF